MATVAKPHQAACLTAMWRKKAFAVLLKMGRGKTWVGINDACRLIANGLADSMLVVAPPGVTDQWAEQLVEHSPLDFAVLVYKSPSNRTVKYRKLMEAWEADPRPKFLAMHFEAFVTDAGISYARELLKKSRTVMILDESTKIKNSRAHRTKAILKLATLAEYRRILTGHPVTKGIENLWAQYSFLDPTLLGNSFFTFRARYCITQPVWGGPKGAVTIVGYRDVDSLMRKVAPITYIDESVPPVVPYILREVAATQQQMDMVKGLQDELVAVLDDQTFQAQNAMSSLVKIQQIASGFIKDDDGNIVELSHHRLEEYGDVLDECGTATLVWCRFHRDIDNIVKETVGRGFTCLEYSGRIPASTRAESLQLFRDGKVDVLAIQLNAGSHGLDIPQAKTSIFYSHTWDAEVRKQAEGRMRAGMINEGLIIDIVVKDIIDERILYTLKNRGDLRCLVEGVIKDLQCGKSVSMAPELFLTQKSLKQASFEEVPLYQEQDFDWTGS